MSIPKKRGYKASGNPQKRAEQAKAKAKDTLVVTAYPNSEFDNRTIYNWMKDKNIQNLLTMTDIADKLGKTTVAVLSTNTISEQDAKNTLKSLYDNKQAQLCVWLPLNNINEMFSSHVSDHSAHIVGFALKELGFDTSKQLQNYYEQLMKETA